MLSGTLWSSRIGLGPMFLKMASEGYSVVYLNGSIAVALLFKVESEIISRPKFYCLAVAGSIIPPNLNTES